MALSRSESEREQTKESHVCPWNRGLHFCIDIVLGPSGLGPWPRPATEGAIGRSGFESDLIPIHSESR